MGHARKEDLLDITDVLEAIRSLPGVSERSFGIFYIGGKSFVHFHTKAGDRWADAKAGGDWGPEVSLPFDSGDRAKSAFLREICARYQVCVEARTRDARAPSDKPVQPAPAKAPTGRRRVAARAAERRR